MAMRNWINLFEQRLAEIDVGGELSDENDETLATSASYDPRQLEMFDSPMEHQGGFDGYDVACPSDRTEYGDLYIVFYHGEPMVYARLDDFYADGLDCYKVDGIRALPAGQGKGIAPRLYRWLVTDGHIDRLYSDEIQTKQGAALWRKLLAMPDLEMYRQIEDEEAVRIMDMNDLKAAYREDDTRLFITRKGAENA
jgi:GNAT superfamily N-acetyltransferase